MAEVRTLTLEDAMPENFSAFGRLISPEGADARTTAFYGDTVEVRDLGGMVTDDQACLSIARVHPREPEVVWMERHFKHEQMFIPLGRGAFAMIVAPPCDSGVPQIDQVRAFRFSGPAPVLLHIGTWHEFPFALDRSVDLAVVLREETNANLDALEDGEAVGGDLEKRRIDRRCGVTLRYRAAA